MRPWQGNTTINTGSGAVTFGGTVNGTAGTETLAVQSSEGNSFQRRCRGHQGARGALTTDAGGTTIAKSVNTAGPIAFNDDVTLNGTYDSSAGNGAFTAGKSTTLAGNTTINSGNGSVTFSGAVDGTVGSETLVVQSSGATVFSAAVGASKAVGGLTTDAGGTTSAKSVTAAGPISFNDDVTLNGTYDSSAGNGAFTAAKSTILAGNTPLIVAAGRLTSTARWMEWRARRPCSWPILRQRASAGPLVPPSHWAVSPRLLRAPPP